MIVAVVPTVPPTSPVKALASSSSSVGPNGSGTDTDPITETACAAFVDCATTKQRNTHPNAAVCMVAQRSSVPASSRLMQDDADQRADPHQQARTG